MADDLQFVLRHYNHNDSIRAWLTHLWATSYGHGSQLVMLLGTPQSGRPGLPDNGAAADQILRVLTDAGWIVRAKDPTPSFEQQFFGVGGSPGQRLKGPWYPVEYAYSPRRSCAEAWDWISAGV